MRVCPTLEGNAIPLISHRIGDDQCLARQCGNYHKCHRCVFRGQPAGWQPQDTAIPAEAAPATRRNGITSTPALPAVAATGGATANGKVAGHDRAHRNGKIRHGAAPASAASGRPANTKTRNGPVGKRLAARNAAAE